MPETMTMFGTNGKFECSTSPEFARKYRLILGVILLLSTTALTAQSVKADTRSPKQVVEDYWKLETGGGRLTTEGWNQASRFFLRPSPIPSKRVIVVVGKDYSVWNPVITNGTAEVIVGFQDSCNCNLDPELKLVPSKTISAIKTSVRFNLVLTSRHSEIDSQGRAVREVEGAPEWRIDVYSTNSPIWLTVDAAIRYLTGVRDEIKDPNIQKNADVSLEKLKRLRR
jgi:hypothetical protein